MVDIYARNPVIVLREESDDWAILYNPDSGQSMGINPTGIDIWKKINGSNDINNIIKEINQEYENVSPDVENEINSFIQNLSNQGFIIF